MTPLPAPDGGWRHLLRSAMAVVVLWAIAAFTLFAFLFPGIDPQCRSVEIGRECRLPSNPEITDRFDVAWPEIPEGWAAAILVVSILLGIAIALFIDTGDPWAETGGAQPVAGFLSGLLGCGVGILIAGPGFTRPLVALSVTGGGVLLTVLGLLGARMFRNALRMDYAAHLRHGILKQRGTRTIATITELVWEQRYLGENPVFTVTAELGRTPEERVLTDELCVPREQAPVVGGTVVVIHDDQTDHRTGIDVLLEADPHGLRDPDALARYPKAPEGSPS